MNDIMRHAQRGAKCLSILPKLLAPPLALSSHLQMSFTSLGYGFKLEPVNTAGNMMPGYKSCDLFKVYNVMSVHENSPPAGGSAGRLRKSLLPAGVR